MKRPLLFLAACLLAGSVLAGGGGKVTLDHVNLNLGDKVSLQNGARTFVNYCLNCHAAAYMRYNRLTDIGLTEKQIEDNFLFDKGAKIGDTMTTALNAKDAKEWFGGMPPDLTLVARVRGTDWLYSYMRGFYRDDKATSGWNNRVFPGVSMPHVLHALQGTQRPVYEKRTVDGQEQTELVRLELTTPGALTSPEYDKLTHDLVNFLAYMGEPARAYRANIGIIVLIFLGGLFLVALWLKSEYWKDVK